MTLNPFTLHGMPFVMFYIALMVVTFIVLRRAMMAAETEGVPPVPRYDDPYLIAYLRDGAAEALRVATVALTDRGLLELDGDKVQMRKRHAAELVKRPIEKAVLRCYATPGDGTRVLRDGAALKACEEYRSALERHGLVAGAATRERRLPKVAIAAAVLLGVAAARIVEALWAGRHNLGFLIALSLLSAFLLWRFWRRRLTYAGDEAITDLKVLFKRLPERAASLKPGGESNEMAMLAAVFGLTALPAAAYPFVEKIYPKPQGDSSSSGGDSGSSCGSSCGGGCGGGGCGGV